MKKILTIILFLLDLAIIFPIGTKGSDLIIAYGGAIVGFAVAIFILYKIISYIISITEKNCANKETTSINYALVIYFIIYILMHR